MVAHGVSMMLQLLAEVWLWGKRHLLAACSLGMSFPAVVSTKKWTKIVNQELLEQNFVWKRRNILSAQRWSCWPAHKCYEKVKNSGPSCFTTLKSFCHSRWFATLFVCSYCRYQKKAQILTGVSSQVLNSKFISSLQIAILTSRIANLCPMQMRGPAPNGW